MSFLQPVNFKKILWFFYFKFHFRICAGFFVILVHCLFHQYKVYIKQLMGFFFEFVPIFSSSWEINPFPIVIAYIFFNFSMNSVAVAHPLQYTKNMFFSFSRFKVFFFFLVFKHFGEYIKIYQSFSMITLFNIWTESKTKSPPFIFSDCFVESF